MRLAAALAALGWLGAAGAALYAHGGAAGAQRKLPAHKKYYIGSANLRSHKLVNERAVDSYFRTLRASAHAHPAHAHAQPAQAQRARGRERARGFARRGRVADAGRSEAPPAANLVAPPDDADVAKQSRRDYFRKHATPEKRQFVPADPPPDTKGTSRSPPPAAARQPSPETRRPPYALFYRTYAEQELPPEPQVPQAPPAPHARPAPYRGGASGPLAINAGRRAALTIGRDYPLEQFLAL